MEISQTFYKKHRNKFDELTIDTTKGNNSHSIRKVSDKFKNKTSKIYEINKLNDKSDNSTNKNIDKDNKNIKSYVVSLANSFDIRYKKENLNSMKFGIKPYKYMLKTEYNTPPFNTKNSKVKFVNINFGETSLQNTKEGSKGINPRRVLEKIEPFLIEKFKYIDNKHDFDK